MTSTISKLSLAAPLAARIPFYYGWVVVGVAFVTMAIGVNTRTSFSLLFPPILDEFGWSRATIAATFSIGFAASTVLAPLIGAMMDRRGPEVVIPIGATLTSAGFIASTYATQPWHFYLTLGLMVVGGSMFISYVGHTLFLPNWFSRRRGLAIGIAFSGVGVGSIVLFPFLQQMIVSQGWRASSWFMAILLLFTVVPLNALLQRHRPENLGLAVDGDAVEIANADGAADEALRQKSDGVVDREWVETEWTLKRAVCTRRFWWLLLSFATGLYCWYAVQVHQTRFLIEVGIDATVAALALGLVGLTGIGGQIVIGHFSDRAGREWGWTVSLVGYLFTYLLLLALQQWPSVWLMYLMVGAQGFLGYGLAAVYGSIPAELFGGRRYGIIFGVMGAASGCGAAFGPWATGLFFDIWGSYQQAFAIAGVVSLISIAAMWIAAPRKVRLVAGRIPKEATGG